MTEYKKVLELAKEVQRTKTYNSLEAAWDIDELTKALLAAEETLEKAYLCLDRVGREIDMLDAGWIDQTLEEGNSNFSKRLVEINDWLAKRKEMVE